VELLAMDVVVLFYVGSWFLLNTVIGNLTKTLYLAGFAFPLFLTIVHMVFSWLAIAMYLELMNGGKSEEEAKLAREMRKKVPQKLILPLSASFALSVGFGNLALKYIFPSFNQMLGCTTPLVTIFLAVVITKSRYNLWSYVSIFFIVVGVMLCTAGEVNFHVLGLAFNTGSTVLRGVKSIIQGQLLTENKLDSVTLLYFMAPQTAAILLPLSLFMEGGDPWSAMLGGGLDLWALLVVSGLNACLLNLSQFVVTKITSAVTLQVLGSVKTIVGIGVSIAWFGNPLTFLQVCGIILSMGGVVLYQQWGKKLPKEPQYSRVDQQQPAEFGLKEDDTVIQQAGVGRDVQLRAL
jgi:solute carrier family 35 protein E4